MRDHARPETPRSPADPPRSLRSLRSLLLHPAVLVCAVAGCVASWQLSLRVEGYETDMLRAEFAQHVDERVAALQRTVGAHLEVVASVGHLYAASVEVEREEFRRFVGPALAMHPSIRSIRWVPRISAGPRDVRYPVTYREPPGETEPELGHDLGENPEVLGLLRRAAERGETVVSPFRPAAAASPVVLTVLPVYRSDAGGYALAGPPGRLAGYVLCVTDPQALLAAAFRGLPDRPARVRLYDRTEAQPRALLATHPARSSGDEWDSDPEEATSLQVSRPLAVGGREWETVWRPSYPALRHRPLRPHVPALLTGLLLTLLASGLVAAFLRTRRAVRLHRAQADELEEVNLRLAEEVAVRRRVERHLRQSEAGYRALVDNALFGIYRSTPEGRVTDANPAMLRILGLAGDADLAGLDLARDVYVDPAERERVLAPFRTGARTTTAEVRWRRRDGRPFTVRLSARAVTAESGEIDHFVVIAEDVTERVELEEQLRQSQRVEAIGRLAGGIAHDFNNLLTVILGQTQRLIGAVPESPELRSRLEEVRRCGERASHLTRQLLAFGRRQVLQPRVIDLSLVLREAKSLLRRLIGEHVDLRISAEEGIGATRVDAVQIQQVIMNLVINARDALPPEGGVITIEAADAVVPAGGARSPVVPPGEYVRLSVTDTGCGMEQETREHIFEPFFSTKADGTGLGLATVYGIVRQSGGHVYLESEGGKGSRFEIYLPRVREEVPEPEGGERPGEAPGGRETILITEDEESVLELAAETLALQGYSIFMARDGRDALDLVERERLDVDLLVTDLVMPGMNGLELSERLEAARPGLRTLFMSGYSAEIVAKQGALGPGTAFVQKPFTPGELARRVRQVLDGVRDPSR